VRVQSRKKDSRKLAFWMAALVVLYPSDHASGLAQQSQIEERVGALRFQDIPSLARKAESGDAEAQYMLGRAYYLGQAVARDYGEALKWFRKAADQSYALAEFSLAGIYVEGNGVPKDADEAVKWLQRAADHGYGFAQFTLGYGLEQQGNVSQAAEWYRKAAEGGLPVAENALGSMYQQGRGVKQDSKEAAKWYRKSAEHGHANAQSNLGSMYSEGIGVPLDYNEAARWFRLASDQGWGPGQANLAGLYMRGRGGPRDLVSAYMWCSIAAAGGQQECKQALKVLSSQMKPAQVTEAKQRAAAWAKEHPQYAKAGDLYLSDTTDSSDSAKRTQSAAEAGDAQAQSVLGETYYRAKNYGEALKWFRKSAEQGYAYGQYNLAVMYLEGSGVPKNESEAIKWFTKAADQWHAGAINNLVALYFYGKGVPKDLVAAFMWLRIAANTGDGDSAKNIEAMKTLLTEGQIAEAERRATAWLAEHKKPH